MKGLSHVMPAWDMTHPPVSLLSFQVLCIIIKVQALVDEIWYSKASDAGFQIVYMVTSSYPDVTTALLGSFATSHLVRTHSPGDSVFYEGAQSFSRRIGWFDETDSGVVDERTPPELDDHPWMRHQKAGTREKYFRKAQLWRVARNEFIDTDYFEILDFCEAEWLGLSVEQLLKFQRFLA
jgi:hypothetical protein